MRVAEERSGSNGVRRSASCCITSATKSGALPIADRTGVQRSISRKGERGGTASSRCRPNLERCPASTQIIPTAAPKVRAVEVAIAGPDDEDGGRPLLPHRAADLLEEGETVAVGERSFDEDQRQGTQVREGEEGLLAALDHGGSEAAALEQMAVLRRPGGVGLDDERVRCGRVRHSLQARPLAAPLPISPSTVSENVFQRMGLIR
jgi:hypothetical protein